MLESFLHRITELLIDPGSFVSYFQTTRLFRVRHEEVDVGSEYGAIIAITISASCPPAATKVWLSATSGRELSVFGVKERSIRLRGLYLMKDIRTT